MLKSGAAAPTMIRIEVCLAVIEAGGSQISAILSLFGLRNQAHWQSTRVSQLCPPVGNTCSHPARPPDVLMTEGQFEDFQGFETEKKAGFPRAIENFFQFFQVCLAELVQDLESPGFLLGKLAKKVSKQMGAMHWTSPDDRLHGQCYLCTKRCLGKPVGIGLQLVSNRSRLI